MALESQFESSHFLSATHGTITGVSDQEHLLISHKHPDGLLSRLACCRRPAEKYLFSVAVLSVHAVKAHVGTWPNEDANQSTTESQSASANEFWQLRARVTSKEQGTRRSWLQIGWGHVLERRKTTSTAELIIGGKVLLCLVSTRSTHCANEHSLQGMNSIMSIELKCLNISWISEKATGGSLSPATSHAAMQPGTRTSEVLNLRDASV